MHILDIIKSVFNLQHTDIELIPLKQGMTNDSFIFSLNNERYIIRVPGVNTEKIINRHQEYDVYQAIKDEEFVEPLSLIHISMTLGFIESLLLLPHISPMKAATYSLHKHHRTFIVSIFLNTYTR